MRKRWVLLISGVACSMSACAIHRAGDLAPPTVTGWDAPRLGGERVGAMTSAEDVATEEALTSVDGASAELLWRRVSFEARHGGVIESPAQRSVEHLVSHMRRSGWQGPEVRVGVLASDKPNAFVLVSGHLYVTRGLLDVICDDAELAAVVAHELSHFDDPEAFYAQGLSLSERLEIEAGADEAAVDLLLDASFDPVALARMIARLTNDQPEGWAERRCAYLSHRLNEPLGVLP